MNHTKRTSILVVLDLLLKEGITSQVAVAEVELDLLANLIGKLSHFLLCCACPLLLVRNGKCLELPAQKPEPLLRFSFHAEHGVQIREISTVSTSCFTGALR